MPFSQEDRARLRGGLSALYGAAYERPQLFQRPEVQEIRGLFRDSPELSSIFQEVELEFADRRQQMVQARADAQRREHEFREWMAEPAYSRDDATRLRGRVARAVQPVERSIIGLVDRVVPSRVADAVHGPMADAFDTEARREILENHQLDPRVGTEKFLERLGVGRRAQVALGSLAQNSAEVAQDIPILGMPFRAAFVSEAGGARRGVRMVGDYVPALFTPWIAAKSAPAAAAQAGAGAARGGQVAQAATGLPRGMGPIAQTSGIGVGQVVAEAGLTHPEDMIPAVHHSHAGLELGPEGAPLFMSLLLPRAGYQASLLVHSERIGASTISGVLAREWLLEAGLSLPAVMAVDPEMAVKAVHDPGSLTREDWAALGSEFLLSMVSVAGGSASEIAPAIRRASEVSARRKEQRRIELEERRSANERAKEELQRRREEVERDRQEERRREEEVDAELSRIDEDIARLDAEEEGILRGLEEITTFTRKEFEDGAAVAQAFNERLGMDAISPEEGAMLVRDATAQMEAQIVAAKAHKAQELEAVAERFIRGDEDSIVPVDIEAATNRLNEIAETAEALQRRILEPDLDARSRIDAEERLGSLIAESNQIHRRLKDLEDLGDSGFSRNEGYDPEAPVGPDNQPYTFREDFDSWLTSRVQRELRDTGVPMDRIIEMNENARRLLQAPIAAYHRALVENGTPPGSQVRYSLDPATVVSGTVSHVLPDGSIAIRSSGLDAEGQPIVDNVRLQDIVAVEVGEGRRMNAPNVISRGVQESPEVAYIERAIEDFIHRGPSADDPNFDAAQQAHRTATETMDGLRRGWEDSLFGEMREQGKELPFELVDAANSTMDYLVSPTTGEATLRTRIVGRDGETLGVFGRRARNARQESLRPDYFPTSSAQGARSIAERLYEIDWGSDGYAQSARNAIALAEKQKQISLGVASLPRLSEMERREALTRFFEGASPHDMYGAGRDGQVRASSPNPDPPPPVPLPTPEPRVLSMDVGGRTAAESQYIRDYGEAEYQRSAQMAMESAFQQKIANTIAKRKGPTQKDAPVPGLTLAQRHEATIRYFAGETDLFSRRPSQLAKNRADAEEALTRSNQDEATVRDFQRLREYARSVAAEDPTTLRGMDDEMFFGMFTRPSRSRRGFLRLPEPTRAFTRSVEIVQSFLNRLWGQGVRTVRAAINALRSHGLDDIPQSVLAIALDDSQFIRAMEMKHAPETNMTRIDYSAVMPTDATALSHGVATLPTHRRDGTVIDDVMPSREARDHIVSMQLEGRVTPEVVAAVSELAGAQQQARARYERGDDPFEMFQRVLTPRPSDVNARFVQLLSNMGEANARMPEEGFRFSSERELVARSLYEDGFFQDEGQAFLAVNAIEKARAGNVFREYIRPIAMDDATAQNNFSVRNMMDEFLTMLGSDQLDRARDGIKVDAMTRQALDVDQVFARVFTSSIWGKPQYTTGDKVSAFLARAISSATTIGPLFRNQYTETMLSYHLNRDPNAHTAGVMLANAQNSRSMLHNILTVSFNQIRDAGLTPGDRGGYTSLENHFMHDRESRFLDFLSGSKTVDQLGNELNAFMRSKGHEKFDVKKSMLVRDVIALKEIFRKVKPVLEQFGVGVRQNYVHHTTTPKFISLFKSDDVPTRREFLSALTETIIDRDVHNKVKRDNPDVPEDSPEFIQMLERARGGEGMAERRKALQKALNEWSGHDPHEILSKMRGTSFNMDAIRAAEEQSTAAFVMERSMDLPGEMVFRGEAIQVLTKDPSIIASRYFDQVSRVLAAKSHFGNSANAGSVFANVIGRVNSQSLRESMVDVYGDIALGVRHRDMKVLSRNSFQMLMAATNIGRASLVSTSWIINTASMMEVANATGAAIAAQSMPTGAKSQASKEMRGAARLFGGASSLYQQAYSGVMSMMSERYRDRGENYMKSPQMQELVGFESEVLEMLARQGNSYQEAARTFRLFMEGRMSHHEMMTSTNRILQYDADMTQADAGSTNRIGALSRQFAHGVFSLTLMRTQNEFLNNMATEAAQRYLKASWHELNDPSTPASRKADLVHDLTMNFQIGDTQRFTRTGPTTQDYYSASRYLRSKSNAADIGPMERFRVLRHPIGRALYAIVAMATMISNRTAQEFQAMHYQDGILSKQGMQRVVKRVREGKVAPRSLRRAMKLFGIAYVGGKLLSLDSDLFDTAEPLDEYNPLGNLAVQGLVQTGILGGFIRTAVYGYSRDHPTEEVAMNIIDDLVGGFTGPRAGLTTGLSIYRALARAAEGDFEWAAEELQRGTSFGRRLSPLYLEGPGKYADGFADFWRRQEDLYGQVLDPATGTLGMLVDVIYNAYQNFFEEPFEAGMTGYEAAKYQEETARSKNRSSSLRITNQEIGWIQSDFKRLKEKLGEDEARQSLNNVIGRDHPVWQHLN